MDMQVIGLCRFSYPALGGFQVLHDTTEERIAYLYAQDRLEERFRLFETVALPCVRAQTDPDFHIIIVIGDQMPKHHVTRLEALIEDIPQMLIHREPPRKQREVMQEILNEARINPNKPCLQFRFDDDDAVGIDFVAKLRRAAADCGGLLKRHRTVAFDWNGGLAAGFGADGIQLVEFRRAYYVAALGMFVKGNCTHTIMNYSHHRVARFMPTITQPDWAMFVRGLNGYNDSRQGKVPDIPVELATAGQLQLLQDRFGIDADHVKRVFSAP